jgi:hypothetical protein
MKNIRRICGMAINNLREIEKFHGSHELGLRLPGNAGHST